MKGDVDLRFVRAIDRWAGSLLLHALSPWLRSDGRRPPPDPAAVKRILLIKFYGIGNIVMILPSIEALRKRFPGASIDFLSLQKNAGILEGTGLDELLLLDSASAAAFLGSTLRLLPRLRRRGYDLIVDFEQFARVSAILAALAGAPARIGFSNPAQVRDFLYTTRVLYLDYAHMTSIFLRLARAAGADDEVRIPVPIPLDEKHRLEASAVEREAGVGPDDTAVILHPGTSEPLSIRRWPVERFALLADRLEERQGVKVIVSGGAEEVDLAASLIRAMRRPAFNAAGRLSVKGFAALAERSELVVTNDTAPVHVASAMGTPVVGIFGPNTPFLYGPLGRDDLVFYRNLHCSPCLLNLNAKLSDCSEPRCIDLITAVEVAEAVERTYFRPEGGLRPAFKKTRRILHAATSPGLAGDSAG
jgi:ADP-heptose:LPS heptosyltransferase